MRFLSRLGAAAMAISIAAIPAHSQIVDVQQPTVLGLGGFDFANQWSIQSFIPTLLNSDGGAVWVRYFGRSTATATGVLDMELWTGVPGTGGASELAGNTAAFSVTGNGANTGGHFVDVFWNAVTVTPATTYYLVFSATMDNPADATNVVFGYDEPSPYPDGEILFQASGGGSITDSYDAYPNGDFAFKEYSSPNGVVGTPEPASIVLFGTGLAGLAGVARRRRPS